MILNRLLRRILCASLVILLAMAGSTSCGDSGPAAPDAKTLLTSGTWKVKTVIVDGLNQDELFTDLVISFTATSFTSTSGGALWPATGTWTFANSDQKLFTRNDDVQVTIETISETELTLSLLWSNTTLGDERVASIQGNYVFVFGK